MELEKDEMYSNFYYLISRMFTVNKYCKSGNLQVVEIYTSYAVC